VEVRSIEVRDSPWGGGRVRLRGEVAYQSGGGGTEEYWFDVPAEHASCLSTSGNPWLVCLLPLAATLGEPLRISLPVDRLLIESAPRLLEIWRAWYPQLAGTALEVDAAAETPAREGARCAAFFSGGVDSFFTALRPRESAAAGEQTRVDELITIGGFDIPLERAAALAGLRANSARAAADLGKGHVDVVTNLRTTRWDEAAWGPLAHGCGLASTALALELRFHTVLIPATGGYRDLHAWGSHPLTDPLLSTAATRIVHDGAAFTRIQKTTLLCASPVALRSLRVCFESRTERNCGRCNKCCRTMLILELLGALEHCSTFPARTVDLRRFSSVYCREAWDYREFRDIRDLALSVGRRDAARAATRAMRRSHGRTWVLDGLRGVRAQLLAAAQRVGGSR
jgi:hypothetical protein